MRYVGSGLLAVVLISLLGVWLVRRAGEAEAIRDAKDQTRIAAQGSVEPVLTDALVRGDPKAISELDRVIQERVLGNPSTPIVRVKIWDRSGRVLYSNEPRLIGASYAMSPHDLAEFKGTRVDAAVTDLTKPENRFERGLGKLLEVYMPIHTPSGRPLRYEEYYKSSFISARARRIFRQFAPAMLGALILLALIQLPLAWQLARRVRKGQDEREGLLRRAIEASDVERRRIARDLHDGVVQDLAGVSLFAFGSCRGCPHALRREAARGRRRDPARNPPAPDPPRGDLSARAPPRRTRRGSCRPAHSRRVTRARDEARRRSRSQAWAARWTRSSSGSPRKRSAT